MATVSPLSEAAIWERVIHPDGKMTKEAARGILGLSFSPADEERMHDLLERNRRGELTEEEEAELDHFCRVGTLLSILKLRAGRVLKSRKNA